MSLKVQTGATLVTLMFLLSAMPGFAQSAGEYVDCDGDGEEDDLWLDPNDYESYEDPSDGACSIDHDENTPDPQPALDEECKNEETPEDPDGTFPECLDNDVIVPGKVTNVSFSNIMLQNFTVNWTAPVEDRDDVANYIIYHRTSAFSDTTGVANVTVAVPEDDEDTEDVVESNYIQYEFTDLVNGTTYYLAITAVDDFGNEGDPVFVDVTTKAPAIVFESATRTLGGDLVPMTSATSIAVSESDEEFTYLVASSADIAPGKVLGIDIEIIGNFDLAVGPVAIDVDRVELTSDRPNATVNITFEDDDLGFGDRSFVLRHTMDLAKVNRDTRYDIAPVADLGLTILEDEVEPSISLADAAALEATEGGDDNMVSFQVKLTREPTDDVFLKITSSDETRLQRASNHFLLFGVGDWDTFQTVRLRVPDNDIVDGDRPVIVTIDVDPEGTAPEYVERAPQRQVTVMVYDDEEDEDGDGILDSEERKPEDRFNKDYRPTEFKHQLSSDGRFIQFTWTAHHLDTRIQGYVIWEFSEPTEFAYVPVVEGQRYYNHSEAFAIDEIHTYSLQAVLHTDPLNRDGSFIYDEEAAVPLGAMVFTKSLYQTTCGTGAIEDSDGDGVCDAFEELAGLDPNEADSDGDGRDDGRELFEDRTDPLDPDSHGHVLPLWARNPWFIIGTILFIAAIVVTIVSFARRDDGDYAPAA